MNVTKFTTFYKIENDYSDEIEDLKTELSARNFQTNELEPFAYFQDGNSRYIRIPSGFGDRNLREILGNVRIDKDNRTVQPINPEYYELRSQPYGDQVTVLNKVIQHFRNGGNQCILNIPTGRGKTYCAINITYNMRVKPLIMVKSRPLAEQWVESYKKHTSMNHLRVNYMTGYGDLMAARECADEYDVFITTHASIRNFIKDHGYIELNALLVDLGIGIKIFDECDLEVKNILRMDCHTSIRYTLYLTATFFKSSHDENKIYQKIFDDMLKIDTNDFQMGAPNRNAHIIYFKSRPTQKEFMSCFSYSDMFVGDKYMSYVMNKENFIKALEIPINHIKELKRSDSKLKFIFFCGKIANCDVMKNILVEKYGFRADDIGIFNSEVSDKEKPYQLAKPIICSTTKSMGRGLDISGLKVLVNCEVFGSGSIFKQLTGRVGRHGGAEGFYYELVDLDFKSVYLYFMKRKGYLKEEFSTVKHTNIHDDTRNRYDVLHDRNSNSNGKKGMLYSSKFYTANRVPEGTILLIPMRKPPKNISIDGAELIPTLAPSFRTFKAFNESNRDFNVLVKNYISDSKTPLFREGLLTVLDYIKEGKDVCLLSYGPHDKDIRQIICDIIMEQSGCNLKVIS